MAAVWAGSAIAEARTIHKMKKLQSISEKSAKKSEEFGVHRSYLEELVKLGRVKRTEDNRYYVVCKDGKHC